MFAVLLSLQVRPSFAPFHERQILMPPDGTRRSGRIPKQIAITLVGSDIEGRVFSEQTKTVVLSRHGAGIVSSYKLSPEQELVIRGDTYIYGIAFLSRDVDFWGIEFPDLSETERRASQTLLECSSCHSRELADHSDLASDVMAINDGIVRYCQKCGSSTVWRQAAPGALPTGDGGASANDNLQQPGPPGSKPADLPTSRPLATGTREPESSFAGAPWTQAERAAPAVALEPVTTPASAYDVATAEAPADRSTQKERENRRKHARTRVNFKACVRRPGLADDVVACEDMSRGGLRFKSTRKYFEKMLIDVAVPYSSGDQAIFVPAQIAYVQELPEQKLYRCGVTYLRSSGR
jgi:hypothetical protein